MDNKWLRQTKDKPLFSDLLWSRPENKRLAGKLLIIGGNQHGFAAPAEAYSEATKAGAGTIRVVLPDKLQKTVSRIFPAADFAASTPSGSFSQAAQGEILEQAAWADGVLVAGDLAHNSETAILLEKFTDKYNGPMTFTKDAVDYFTLLPAPILQRRNTLLVLSMAQLQKLGKQARFSRAFTFDMDVLRLAEALNEFGKLYPIKIIVKQLENIFVAVEGEVSVTKLDKDLETWRVIVASHAAVWWLQNQSNSFKALTTSIVAVS